MICESRRPYTDKAHRQTMHRIILIGLCGLFFAACGGSTTSPSSPPTAESTQQITIMTFNVENLFDTNDDAGKDDKAYLPLEHKSDPDHIASCNTIEVDRWRRECLELDWSEDALDFKLRQLARAIQQVGDGAGPDVIAFQEVENAGVLTRLSRDYLPDSGYGDANLIEGRDLRGIDVAFLSRLPLVGEPKLHAFDASAFPNRADDTRGVLEATFELPDGNRLTGFSVHFPAPFHPIEMRELA